MEFNVATVRAPRLTENRLEDLSEAVLSLDSEIAYLADAVDMWPLGHVLRVRLQSKRERLTRARAWIAGKLVAERAQRGAA